MAKGSLSGYQWTFLYSLEKAYVLKCLIKITWRRLYPAGVLFCNFFQLQPFQSTASPLLAIERMTEIDGPAKATAETPFSFWKLSIQPMLLLLDGALHTKIPKHFCVFTIYTQKMFMWQRFHFNVQTRRESRAFLTHKSKRESTQPAAQSAILSCISCTLTPWARTQLLPWSWVGALGANIQPHRLKTSPCWLHKKKLRPLRQFH